MVFRKLAPVFLLFTVFAVSALAQDNDLQSALDHKVEKMQRELKLTDAQADAIGPIVKDYMAKRHAVLEQEAGQGIIDHVALKGTLKDLKDIEYKNLSKILTDEQMKKWINRDNLMAALNPDNPEKSVEDDVSVGPEGASLKF